MRFRALAAVSALTALTLLGAVPTAQAAAPSAPATTTGATLQKLTPETAAAVDAARAGTPAADSPTGITPHYVCFQAHSRTTGWTNLVCSDGPGFTGTENKNDPIDSVIFTVGGGFDFRAQVHFANTGTTGEVYVPSGYQYQFYNDGNAVEAIHLRSLNHAMKAAAHVQNVGWKGTNTWERDQWIGSIGEARWMEAFWIDLPTGLETLTGQ
ncbi:hypothetical protein [Kitasatospora sp. NPDC056184]|uniref:hypothetical protein n=1 Tax=Kitasatospora sp. NPDC056184 TaxID=3345738 RepID=UPI0035D9EFF5